MVTLTVVLIVEIEIGGLNRHVKRHLRGKVVADDKRAKEVINDIFGENGLLAVDNEYEFALMSFKLEEKYCSALPNLIPYFKKPPW